MDKSPYNPYKDDSLHTTVDGNTSAQEDRTAFNDVIKNADIISGFQRPKQINQFPKWYRTPKKIVGIVSAAAILFYIVYNIVEFIIVVSKGE